MALYLARAALDDHFRSVILAGPRGGEGTTSVLLRAARDLRSVHGLRTLVVDLNRSRTSLGEAFSLDPERSLQAVASGTMSSMEAIQVSPWGVDVLRSTNGRPDRPDREGLGPLLTQVLQHARTKYDVTLVDAPPILEDETVFDVGHVLPRVILVVEAERTLMPVLERTRRELEFRDIELLGMVLNKHRRVIPGWLYSRLSS